MSKPRYYWYGVVCKMIKSKDEMQRQNTLQSAIFLHAIDDALEETRKLPNGDLKVKAVEDILINKTKTYDGVAMEIHYDYRTVQNWVNKFVNLVGKNAGF